MTLPPKRRARGSDTFMNFQYEPDYGVPSEDDFLRLPMVSSTLGAEQGLIESDLLGQGRESFDPTPDVVNNDGDVVVPVDVRFFGNHLMHFFGEPETTGEDAATGTTVFSAQPAVDSTITINGTAFTFKASGASGNQINIGADLAATLIAIRAALNASAVSGVAQATYTNNTTTLTVTHDTAGAGGNTFTLAAQVASNGTVSGAKLSGGTSSHTFASGLDELPSASVEFEMTAAQSFRMNYGLKGNTMRIAMSRSGLLNATLSYIAKGETLAGTSAAGTVAEIDADDVLRFAQAAGEIRQDGDLLGNIVSATYNYSNNLDKVETIQPDGEIEGADEGMSASTGEVVMKFAGQDLLDQATSAPVDLSWGWTRGAYSLTFSTPRVFLPKVKKPIEGPKGIQATMNWQASGQGGHVVTVVLVNDVAAYALP